MSCLHAAVEGRVCNRKDQQWVRSSPSLIQNHRTIIFAAVFQNFDGWIQPAELEHFGLIERAA